MSLRGLHTETDGETVGLHPENVYSSMRPHDLERSIKQVTMTATCVFQAKELDQFCWAVLPLNVVLALAWFCV